MEEEKRMEQCLWQTMDLMLHLSQDFHSMSWDRQLRKYGVDTSQIVRGGERIGIYYLEKGASQRPSKVIYDRTGSALYSALKEEFDWEKILEGAEWFHFTGITPALNGNLFRGMQNCKKNGCEDFL